VFIVIGHSARDLSMEQMARPQFDTFGRSLSFTYSSDLDIRTLESRLAALPPHTIVYYLLFYQDISGVNVNPIQYLDRVAAVANRPLYSWVDSTLGHGVVGGALERIERQIEGVTGLAIRVLRGERADSIPTLAGASTVNQVDWRQLQRWSLPQRRLPAGTMVLFRPPTIWGRVRPYAIGAAAVMLLQAAMIVLLLAQQHALKRAQGRIHNLGSRLVAAQDQERARIALELHDDVSQQLALLSFDLQVLNGFGPQRDDDVETVAHEALDRLDRIAGSLHALSHRLHPAMLGSIGLVRAIGDLLRDVSRPGVDITFAHSDVPTDLPDAITIAMFRIAQEALRNALEHSDATHISVYLRGDPDRLLLTVADNGGGFDVSAVWGNGLGLIGMHDRLDPIDGTVTVRSALGRGTRVEVDVPIEHSREDDNEADGAARRRSHDGARGAGNAADVGV
jgi:signal transduction histidine kinase